MDLLTKSRLAAARSCSRFHDLVYLRGYRPVSEAETLRFGTLIHRGLEAIWGGGDTKVECADPWDVARAVPMLHGYVTRWRMEDYEVLGVEQQFECDLVNPDTGAKSRTWRLAGKLDAIVREKATGRVLVCEHKTTSQDISAGSAYWARLRMDTQVSVYIQGARALGYDPAGVLYDVLKKPQLRPLEVNSRRAVAESAEEFQARVTADIAENPEKYYQRGEVVRLEDEMADAMRDTWQTAQQLHEAEHLNRSPRNPDACNSWNRLCSFFPVCSGETTLDNQLLYQLKTDVHPELA